MTITPGDYLCDGYVLFVGFVVLPGRKWVLETNRDYEILIEIYDKDSHRIYPSDVSLACHSLPLWEYLFYIAVYHKKIPK